MTVSLRFTLTESSSYTQTSSVLVPRTLAFKLSAAFLLLTFLITSISLYVTTQGVEQGILEADQQEAIPVAQELARQIKDHVAPSISQEAVYALFIRFSKLNSRLIPYLINHEGEIIVSSVDKAFLKSDRIDISVARSFIKNFSKLPILIQNPKNQNLRVPFAATQITSNPRDPILLLTIEPRAFLENHKISSTEKSILIQGLLSFVAAAFLGLLLSRILTKRLRNLTDAVKGFEGNQKDKIQVINSSDEVGELSSAFSRMAEAVSASVEKLKHRDALRRELIAGVSHDLRTPLAAIKGYVEKLQQNPSSPPEKIQETLNVIERNCKVLQKLIDGLFELAHLEEIVERIELVPFSLSDLVSDVVAKFSVQASTKNISIAFIPPTKPHITKGDPSLIERALSNIIENAILYTGEGGSITTSIEQSSDYFIIKIQDTGRGISKEDIPNIFEKFFRGDKSRGKDIAGTGLGLAVTKKIIDAHRGNIRVESQINVGTIFFIDLPS